MIDAAFGAIGTPLYIRDSRISLLICDPCGRRHWSDQRCNIQRAIGIAAKIMLLHGHDPVQLTPHTSVYWSIILTAPS